MSDECSREELHNPTDYDVGDIVLCICDERVEYHNKLFRCVAFSKDGTSDYTDAQLLYRVGNNPKGRSYHWYTRRFAKWTGEKECKLCISSCKKEEPCVFFNPIFEFPEVGENG